jgi:hypothetical protein
VAVALLTAGGCNNPPPPRIQVPSDSRGSDYATYHHDKVKPLPPQPTDRYSMEGPTSEAAPAGPPAPGRTGAGGAESRPAPPPPPPVSQAYLDAYDRVGRPRLMVVVERPEAPPHSLVPGDYDTLERAVHESLSANGQVSTVPSDAVRSSLSPQQIKAVVDGDRTALGQAGQALRADVIVSVRLEPPAGDQTKISAVARNAQDGQTIATVTSTLPSPPPRRQIDFAGRLLGERMVDDLADAWDRLAAQGPPTQPGAGTTAPAGAGTTAPSGAPPSPPPPSTRP